MPPAAAIPASPTAKRVLPRPRARSIGIVLLVSGAVAMLFVPAGPVAQCGAWALGGAAQTYLVWSLVLIAGVALILRLPKCSAAAPALALGAALPVIGAAFVGWIAFAQDSCALSDSMAVFLVVETAGALAVATCAIWLLYARDELEPWYGTRGVVWSASCGALIVLAGIGIHLVGAMSDSNPVLGVAFLAGPLVWGGVIALCGWLRRTPAIALTVCSGLQVVWLLLR